MENTMNFKSGNLALLVFARAAAAGGAFVAEAFSAKVEALVSIPEPGELFGLLTEATREGVASALECTDGYNLSLFEFRSDGQQLSLCWKTAKQTTVSLSLSLPSGEGTVSIEGEEESVIRRTVAGVLGRLPETLPDLPEITIRRQGKGGDEITTTGRFWVAWEKPTPHMWEVYEQAVRTASLEDRQEWDSLAAHYCRS